MKALLIPLACVALSGCVAYGDPLGMAGYGYPGYGVPSSYGSYGNYGTYGSYGAPGTVYPGGYMIPAPQVHPGGYVSGGVVVQPGYAPAPRRMRDSDGDGVPDRVDAYPRDPRYR